MNSATSPALPPRQPIWLSRLWREESSRGVIIQILVVLGFFAAIAWLVGNVLTNFAALDKSFGFGFLWELPANYDINQTLIDYNNQDTHARAALVGLINTGLVAIMGIVIATLLGFTLGAMRLSSNWLVARLAYCFVEFTRNVPVLLHILLWHGIIIHTLPHPRQALGLGDTFFLSNRGFYIPKPVFEEGSWVIFAAFAVAMVITILVRRHAKRVQDSTGRYIPALWIGAAVLLGLPAIACIAAGTPVSFEVPALRGFNFQGGLTLIPELVALTWALGIYTAAFVAENVRSGILAVHKGQREAAESLGLRPNRVLSLVVLPQALRVIIPPLTSQYLNLTKNSSLAIAIGYMDLVATLGGITLNQTGREMESMMLVMLIYLAISLVIAGLMNWFNQRAKLVER
ncbi:MAG: ABC transporter permease subunit [Proteobacteria bacterium]|nr:ABC transporter permease subunit [Pseudomonadota bacterium]